MKTRVVKTCSPLTHKFVYVVQEWGSLYGGPPHWWPYPIEWVRQYRNGASTPFFETFREAEEIAIGVSHGTREIANVVYEYGK